MAAAEQQNNYVLGRGKLYFDKFKDNVNMGLTGERYLGNTPSLNMTSAYQNLDHYSSDFGIREKDDTVQLQLDRSGNFTCDNISIENLGVMFGSDPVDETQAPVTGAGERLTVSRGLYYQLGVDDTVPDGVGEVANVAMTDGSGAHATGTVIFSTNPVAGNTVTIAGQAFSFVTTPPATAFQIQIGANPTVTAQGFLQAVNASAVPVTASGAGTTITLTANATGVAGNAITLTATGPTASGATLTGGTAGLAVPAAGNWEVDLGRGRIHILDDATGIINGQNIDVTYDIVANTRAVVVDEGAEVEGALRFVADNPKGSDKDYYWPRVKLTPSGDYALKGDTWQTMTFNFDVLKKGTMKRVYVREVPLAA